MAFGVYGKHPAKGDFLEHGLPPALRRALESWLDGALAEARGALGPAWEGVWPAAPHLMFWLGEGIWGEPVAGVLAPSRDRVGRRFPLVFVASGPDAPPPPVTAASQDWWAALSAHARAALGRADLPAPAALMDGAPRPAGEGVAAPVAGGFWASRPGAGVAALWEDVALADHRRAAALRSYWWVEGEAPLPAPAEPPPAEGAADEPAAEAIPDLPPDAGDEAAAAPQDEGAASPPPGDPAAGDEAPVAAEEVPAEDGPPPEPEEEDVWALVGVTEEDEGSPFDGPAGGLGLFAAPAPAAAAPPPLPVAAPAPVQAAAPLRRREAQIWAGDGLPGGAVLAWFFSGYAGNG